MAASDGKKRKNIKAGLKLFIKERSKLHGQIEGLPSVIKELREVATSNPDEVYYAVRLFLDHVKYGIKKVGYKPEIVRVIERWWIRCKRRLAGREDN